MLFVYNNKKRKIPIVISSSVCWSMNSKLNSERSLANILWALDNSVENNDSLYYLLNRNQLDKINHFIHI